MQRAGSQAAAFGGEAAWTPQRRFAACSSASSLPGFGRAERYDLLTALGAAGRYELEAGELLAEGEDATTEAAKRVLRVRRQAAARAPRPRRWRRRAACRSPRSTAALAVWGTPGDHAELTVEAPAPIRAGLSLR